MGSEPGSRVLSFSERMRTKKLETRDRILVPTALAFCHKMCYTSIMISDPTVAVNKEKKGYTIGRKAFAKISAVEGIYLSEGQRNEFAVFEQKGLSAQDRREAILKKYTR